MWTTGQNENANQNFIRLLLFIYYFSLSRHLYSFLRIFSTEKRIFWQLKKEIK